MKTPDRYFAFLVRLLPASFRARHGDELRVLLEQMKDDLGPSPNTLALLRLYLAVTWDHVLWQSSLIRPEPTQGVPLVAPTGSRSHRWSVWWGVLRQGLAAVVTTAKRDPAFTAAVVITLGLGIGANATLYGIVDRLLLQPPAHVEDHERVQRVFVERLDRDGTGELVMEGGMSYLDYADLKSHGGLSAVAAYTPSHEETIGSGEFARRAHVAEVSAEFFPLLGVSPILGRFYTADESARGSALTAVLGAEYWRSVYGADPGVLGRTIEVYRRVFTIIGVAPTGFTGINLAKVDLWLPLEATFEASGRTAFNRGCCAMGTVSRLKDGMSIEAAEAEATRLVRNGRREAREDDRVRLDFESIVTGQDASIEDVAFDPRLGPQGSAQSRVARWLAGVSVIVLLIACANVANLLMARGTRQRKDVSVRMALGAARGRVIGQMMVESMLLALAGGLLALILAWWGGEIVRSTLLPDVYFPDSPIQGRVVAFTALAALVAGVAAGIVPALQGSRADITGGLGAASRGSSAHRSKLRGFFTIAQAAMSVVLLVGAGLFVRSLSEVRSIDLGLDVDRLLLAELEYRSDDIRSDEVVALYEEAIRRLSALPGVRSAAATTGAFQLSLPGRRFSVPGVDSIPQVAGGGPYSHVVSPGYFETVGVDIVRGRSFQALDAAESARVAIVSETMARVLWPGRDALGGCLVFERNDGVRECTTVVGVAEDVARGGFQDVPGLTYYLPQQPGGYFRRLYVRAEGDPDSILGDVATLLRSYSPKVRYAEVHTLQEMLAPEARAWTLGATMFALFGLLALCLAAVGLYSVLAFDVAQRTRELGIRAALGATRGRLLEGVLLHAGGLAVSGVVLGLGVAYVAAPYARELLFQVSPRDPAVFTGAALALVAVGVLASLVPGLRATAADATEALRAE